MVCSTLKSIELFENCEQLNIKLKIKFVAHKYINCVQSHTIQLLTGIE